MKGLYLGQLNNEIMEYIFLVRPDFIWLKSDNQDDLRRIKSNGIKIYYPCGVFSACIKEYEDEKEGFRAIDKDGKPINVYSGWYRGLCPTNSTIRDRRIREIRKAFSSDFYEGVWLDAIRYPTYWEAKDPEYLDTCYCGECKQMFKLYAFENWNKFRNHQIESFLQTASALKGGKTLGYFAVPEKKDKLMSIFAQNPDIFKDKVDFVSPMIYPQMVGKDIKWAEDINSYFVSEFGGDRVLPVVQTIKMPDESLDAFSLNDFVQLSDRVSESGNIGYFMLDQLIDKLDYLDILSQKMTGKNESALAKRDVNPPMLKN